MEEAVERVLICSIIASASVVYCESMKTRKRKYWIRDYFRERDHYSLYTRLWGTCFFFCYFPIQGYPMWTHAQILLKDFDRICSKVIFRSLYFNRQLPVASSQACFLFLNFPSLKYICIRLLKGCGLASVEVSPFSDLC